jgi:predicted nucleic acid-binding protein
MDKLYLDTSIPSAYYDNSKPLRQLITQKWFENEANFYELYISNLVFEELSKLPNQEKRETIEDLIYKYKINILNLTKEAQELANLYMKKGAIPYSESVDALHIAVATVNRIESLASWNFKHIVSINPIRKIHEINSKEKYQIIEIGSLEIYGGAKYGNL